MQGAWVQSLVRIDPACHMVKPEKEEEKEQQLWPALFMEIFIESTGLLDK